MIIEDIVYLYKIMANISPFSERWMPKTLMK